MPDPVVILIYFGYCLHDMSFCHLFIFNHFVSLHLKCVSSTMACVAQLVGHHFVNQKVTILKGPCLGCRFGPKLGHVWKATSCCFISMLLSLSFPLPSLSLKSKLEIKIKKKIQCVSSIFVKVDRFAGIINFQRSKDPNNLLNDWSQQLNSLMSLVNKITHLIAREEMIHNVQ